MKLRTKSIITLTALLLSAIGTFAQGTSAPQSTVSYLLDGEKKNAEVTGIVECTFSGTTATIVCRPIEGNYIKAEDIIVYKTVSGSSAQTREPGIDNSPIAITAASTNTTPREESSYTFTAEEDPNLTYEITANFHQLKDLEVDALIKLPEDAIYTYTGQAIEPEFTVSVTDVELKKDEDYTVEYKDNVNAGTGSITITATTKTIYKGSKTVNFDINQADVSFWFENADGSEPKEDQSITFGETFTEPTLKMSEEGATEVIEVTYSVNDESVATIDASTGKLTILKAGTIEVTAAAAKDYTNEEGSNYKADPEKTKTSYKLTIKQATPTLKFSATTATATMGTEFDEPTLTVTPETLVPIEYESTKPEFATVDKNTGVVTLVGKGETTIKAVFPGNEIYEAAEASYTLTIKQVKTELKYSTDKVTVAMGAEFEAPTLTVSPEGLTGITYTSSNTDAATISAEGKVTLVGKGETKITASFAGNEIYEAAEASYTLTIKQVKTELKYSTDKVTVAMGAEFEAPTLTVSPEGLTGITYTSSNTNAATISAEGKVTLVGEGETVIKASFAGNAIYEPAEASYTLTVEKGVGEGYALWIGETQVTKDNCEHILGNKDLTFAFNPDSKILLITNNQDEDIVIESRLDELTIYLNGNKDSKSNKLKKVFFNNLGNAENKGKLVFTTNYNVPGSIDLKNDQGESVITGFESVEFDSKSKLTFALPEKTTYEYKNGAMTKTVVDENGTETTSAADELSIGQSLTPIDETVTFTLNNLYLRDEEGNLITDDSGEPTLPNLVNSVVKDVLITLPGSNDNNSGDGISLDDSDGRVGITIETLSMTDDKVKTIAQKVISDDTYFPGSDAFANDFVGMTILLPACTGSITTDLNLDPGYEFHALIAEEDAGKLKSTIKVIPAGKVETPFDVAMPSYCYIYLVQIGASTRLGKREKVHGKVYSVGVSVSKARSVNPPSEASGGALPASGDPNVNEETTPAPPTGIISVNREQQTVKSGWYTLDGQKIAEPKQRGLYIKDGKKVAIK